MPLAPSMLREASFGSSWGEFPAHHNSSATPPPPRSESGFGGRGSAALLGSSGTPVHMMHTPSPGLTGFVVSSFFAQSPSAGFNGLHPAHSFGEAVANSSRMSGLASLTPSGGGASAEQLGNGPGAGHATSRAAAVDCDPCSHATPLLGFDKLSLHSAPHVPVLPGTLSEAQQQDDNAELAALLGGTSSLSAAGATSSSSSSSAAAPPHHRLQAPQPSLSPLAPAGNHDTARAAPPTTTTPGDDSAAAHLMMMTGISSTGSSASNSEWESMFGPSPKLTTSPGVDSPAIYLPTFDPSVGIQLDFEKSAAMFDHHNKAFVRRPRNHQQQHPQTQQQPSDASTARRNVRPTRHPDLAHLRISRTSIISNSTGSSVSGPFPMSSPYDLGITPPPPLHSSDSAECKQSDAKLPVNNKLAQNKPAFRFQAPSCINSASTESRQLPVHIPSAAEAHAALLRRQAGRPPRRQAAMRALAKVHAVNDDTSSDSSSAISVISGPNGTFTFKAGASLAAILKAQPVQSDDDEIRVGTYTQRQRRAKIARFRDKRKRRCFTRKVHYACRSNFATNRKRVGGRFVKLTPEDSAKATGKKGSGKGKNKRSKAGKRNKKNKSKSTSSESSATSSSFTPKLVSDSSDASVASSTNASSAANAAAVQA